MRSYFRAGFIAISLLILGGCATRPTEPIAVTPAALTGRIGVAMSAVPKPDTSLPGAGCLLCIAAASVANSRLIDHSRTLSPEDLPKLKDELALRLRKKGADPVIIDEPIDVGALERSAGSAPNAAQKDFRPIAAKYSVDKLLLIELSLIGMERTYQAYIPSGPPKAAVRGFGSMVDLQSNTYLWFQPIEILKSAEGQWDEPPNFPGLTNAYFQAIELAKDAVLEPFGR